MKINDLWLFLHVYSKKKKKNPHVEKQHNQQSKRKRS